MTTLPPVIAPPRASRSTLDTFATWTGLVGSLLIATATVATALAYRGRQGEPSAAAWWACSR
jgi:Na+/melibiose symporter-like transporter